ncbi:hypothetical protein DOTSEDRAFT_75186 [Dothistroma septosporum NZE10]|uniref:Uncharacterized protein n=1 Tax=Dothistroma septosporum (strain NZE10 / CBS 128990) TaxID=675120 RepID=M2Y286_DOTSN|nr:hypothetical protein DOTSEDRAFT_75186 [Dothistroma septosporum NZE10]
MCSHVESCEGLRGYRTLSARSIYFCSLPDNGFGMWLLADFTTLSNWLEESRRHQKGHLAVPLTWQIEQQPSNARLRTRSHATLPRGIKQIAEMMDYRMRAVCPCKAGMYSAVPYPSLPPSNGSPPWLLPRIMTLQS